MSQIQTTTRTQRTLLPVDEIQRLLDEGHRQSDVAELFGTTQPTISRIIRHSHSPAGNGKQTPSTPICTCCGERTVAEGHRFLCAWCFSHGDTGGLAFSEHALAI